jgi:hypothetical protein
MGVQLNSKLPAYWSVIGCITNAQPPVLSPSSSQYLRQLRLMHFHSRKEKFGAFKKCHLVFFTFLKLCVHRHILSTEVLSDCTFLLDGLLAHRQPPITSKILKARNKVITEKWE